MVAIVNVAVVDPAGTVTVVGKVAQALFDASVTTIPPVGAGPFSVMVPVELVEPSSDAGERLRVWTCGA